MNSFSKVLKRLDGFDRLLSAANADTDCVNVLGVSETAKAHMLSALLNETGKRALIISPNEISAKRFAEDMETFCKEPLARIVADDVINAQSASFDIIESRLKAIDMLCGGASATVGIAALLCFVMPKKLYEGLVITPDTGVVFDDLPAALVVRGYKRVHEISGKGQFAVRGGIVDVFCPVSDMPYRIELFDNEVDSIRLFDMKTQLSSEKVSSARITAANGYKGTGCILDYFDSDTIFVIDEPQKVSQAAEAFLKGLEERMAEMAQNGRVFDEYPAMRYEDLLKSLVKGSLIGFCALSAACPDYKPRETISFMVKALPSYSGKIDILADDVKNWANKDYSIFIMAGSPGREKGIHEALKERDIRSEICAEPGAVPKGVAGIYDMPLYKSFEYPHIKTVFVSGSDIFVDKKVRRRYAKDAGKVILSFDELQPGDFVVHRSHGIGKFEDLCTMQVSGKSRDYLKIVYRGSDVLYVPVNQLNLLYKYSHAGADAPEPKLNRLGGVEWSNTTSRVKGSVKKLAFSLIELYAERNSIPGRAFSKDTGWQEQFESEFIYEETPDQLKSIEEIKRDMENPRPMDRLLCGDVGYGKTEVALRSVFKCVMDGCQCAFLVPTTILASQHYNNFRDRMKNFPIKIEMLSRFRTKAQQKEIIRGMRTGEIDVVVGTHRLLGDDVEFKKLGLLVVDEEHRFGVSGKEKIKNMKRGIDVLTLTATPIPRTLNMAMTSVRDMSVISMPPEERCPIQTYVMEHDRFTVKDAIERELSRGGQVYYVHNTIAGIYGVASKIGQLFPHASIAVAHGRMREEELEDVMMRVLSGEVDILVCTTIIESGVDIPNVNTMIVENADRMGLAQLYQLRGRVGRADKVAYAYLTYKRDKALSEVAEKRLMAIREFTELGSGFKIALRDLEIRGAGNILGPEQHGFMASVGYDMYIRLLEEAVAEITDTEKTPKTEAVIDIAVEAKIPDSYIEDPSLRLEAYRMIAGIEGEEDKLRVTEELIDRFGSVPCEALTLIEVALLRVYAGEAGVLEINGGGDKVIFLLDKNNLPSVKAISGIIANNKRGVLFSAGDRPYITLKTEGITDAEIIKKIKSLLKDLKVT